MKKKSFQEKEKVVSKKEKVVSRSVLAPNPLQ
jgi:hypothetical protein